MDLEARLLTRHLPEVRQVSVPQLGCVAFVAGHLALRQGRAGFKTEGPARQANGRTLKETGLLNEAPVVTIGAFEGLFWLRSSC